RRSFASSRRSIHAMLTGSELLHGPTKILAKRSKDKDSPLSRLMNFANIRPAWTQLRGSIRQTSCGSERQLKRIVSSQQHFSHRTSLKRPGTNFVDATSP